MLYADRTSCGLLQFEGGDVNEDIGRNVEVRNVVRGNSFAEIN